MDIPNLSNNINQVSTNISPTSLKVPKTSKLIIIIIIFAGITSGFWISRFLPTKTTVSKTESTNNLIPSQAAKIVEGEEIKVGVTYGNLSKNFSDSAIGTVKSGGINGEGTHTLERQGGVTQNAALTSSAVDLDLFIGKKVEVQGETNESNKAGWFMDVGSIKIIE
jgi:hypothetical protein